MENIYINLKEQEDYFVWNYLRKEFKKDLISIEELVGCVELLVGEVDHLEEKVQDLENDIRDNYRPIGLKEMYE